MGRRRGDPNTLSRTAARRLARQAAREGFGLGQEDFARKLLTNSAREGLRQQAEILEERLAELKAQQLLEALPRIKDEDWTPAFQRGVRAALTTILQVRGASTRNMGAAFGVDDPVMQQYLDSWSLRLADDVSETSRKHIQKILTNELQKQPVPTERQIAKELRGYYARNQEWRARTTARTETTRGINAADYMRMRDSGLVPAREWVPKPPAPNRRKNHQALRGEVAPIDRPFSNGDWWPHDINCECRTRPVMVAPTIEDEVRRYAIQWQNQMLAGLEL